MKRRTITRICITVSFAVLMIAIAGCAHSEPSAAEKLAVRELTWQEAKASTQAMELEIADLIPKDVVMEVLQPEKGTLLSCDKNSHTWNSVTSVKLVPNTEIEPVVKAIEAHYAETQFETSHRLDILDNYEAAIGVSNSAELYLVGKEGEDTISIDSGSACFTLPEGVYPGGLF